MYACIILYIIDYNIHMYTYCNFTRPGEEEREPGTAVSLHDLMQDVILYHVQKQGHPIDKIDVPI